MSIDENVLITEREETTAPPPGIQRIVSVSYRPGVEHFYDYLDLGQYERIYYGLDETVDRFISESKKEKDLFYREIALLQCFRLTLFLYLLNAELLRRTFRRLADARPEARFYIEKNEPNNHTPYLSTILPEACPDLISRVFLPEQEKAPETSRTHLSAKNILKKMLWPPRIQSRLAQNPKTLFYSDYYRACAVMKKLGGGRCVYYTCAPEPKIFLMSLRHRFSYVQNICSASDEAVYRKKIEPGRVEMAVHALTERSFGEFPELRGVVRDAMAYLFKTELPAIFFQIDRAHELFEQHPSLESVLLDEDLSPFKNALCQVAMKFNKKCFVEAHGALGDKYGYLPLTADYLFAWGEPQKEKLIRWGCPPDRIIVSGCSKYDTYKSKNDRAARERFCKRYGLTSRGRIVSFFPFPSVDRCSPYNKLIQDRVHSILSLLAPKDVQLIIKLHPGEGNRSFYQAWAGQNGAKGKITVIQKMDPLLLVKASDFLIVHDSTMAVDGFAMGKPVIFFPLLPENAFANDSVSELKRYGIFHCPKNMAEFQAALETLMSNPHFELTDPDWSKARKDCLNEDGRLAEEIIGSYLLGEVQEPLSHVKNA